MFTEYTLPDDLYRMVLIADILESKMPAALYPSQRFNEVI